MWKLMVDMQTDIINQENSLKLVYQLDELKNNLHKMLMFM